MSVKKAKSYGALSSLWSAFRRTAARRTAAAVGPQTSAGTRGIPRLQTGGDGRPRCVACALCAAACPADCIRIEAAAPPWLDEALVPTTSERWPVVFELDLGRCLLCGLCESACPEEAISLQAPVVVPVVGERGNLLLHREALLAS